MDWLMWRGGDRCQMMSAVRHPPARTITNHYGSSSSVNISYHSTFSTRHPSPAPVTVHENNRL
eukprot:scaffold3852_cov71-Cyclotella_meneghiniana.AAC.8